MRVGFGFFLFLSFFWFSISKQGIIQLVFPVLLMSGCSFYSNKLLHFSRSEALLLEEIMLRFSSTVTDIN